MASTARNPVPTPSSVKKASAKASGSADAKSVESRISSGDAKRGRLMTALARNSTSSPTENSLACRRTRKNLSVMALPRIKPCTSPTKAEPPIAVIANRGNSKASARNGTRAIQL